MVYFHSHIPKIIELFNLFSKCNNKGDFISDNKDINILIDIE